MLFLNSQKAAVIPNVFSNGTFILLEGNVNLFCDTGRNLRWRDKDMSLPAIWRPSSLTLLPFIAVQDISLYIHDSSSLRLSAQGVT
jgi:hypothetical protein